MDFDSLVRAKNELEPRVAQLRRHLDADRKLLELEQIEEQTAQSGFWDNPDAAKPILKKRGVITDEIALSKRLSGELEDLETATLGRDPFVLVVPVGHPLAKGRSPLSLRELAGEHLLLLDDGHCLRDQALDACRNSRVEELGFRATSLSTLVQMVAGGAGITLLPQLAVPTETAPAHNYILGVDFQGDDIWVATAKGLSHGIRQE